MTMPGMGPGTGPEAEPRTRPAPARGALTTPLSKPESILRLRAGLLLLVALLLVCFGSGTFVARQFSLSFGWALLIGFGFVLLVGFGVWQLTNKSYLAIAIIVTLLTTYLAYDFLRNAVQWGSGVSLVLAAVPLVLLAAAFWDFRRIKAEVRLWLNQR